jgi:hypothetical protein
MKKPLNLGQAIKKAIPDFGKKRKAMQALIKPKPKRKV